MFDLSWGELVLIGIVALIAIGPKELPGVLRTIGQSMSKIRRMASEFQGQFQEAMREAEMTELKKQVDQLSDAARGMSDYNPLEDHNLDGPAPKPEDKVPPGAEPSSPAATVAGLPEPDISLSPTPKAADEGGRS